MKSHFMTGIAAALILSATIALPLEFPAGATGTGSAEPPVHDDTPSARPEGSDARAEDARTFRLEPGTTVDLRITVPETDEVSVRLILEEDAFVTEGMVLSGPGDCREREAPPTVVIFGSAVGLGDVTMDNGRLVHAWDCGVVETGEGPLTVTAGKTSAKATLEIEGAFFL